MKIESAFIKEKIQIVLTKHLEAMYLKIMIARSFHLKTLFTGIWILEVRMSTISENDILAKFKKQDFFFTSDTETCAF